MITVILGAGASFDSFPMEHLPKAANPDLRPPLTKDLFASYDAFREILKRYPECIPIVPRLRTLATTESSFLFERALAQIELEGQHNDERLRQVAAVRFYIRDLLIACGEQWRRASLEATNYRALADSLRHHQLLTGEPIRFITFNYDRLIDWAIESAFDISLSETIESHIAHDEVRLYRPHGSVHWARVIANAEALRRRRVENGHLGVSNERDRVKLAPSIELSDRIEVAGQNFLEDFTIPAIAIPLEGKDSFEFPDQHLAAMREDIKQSDKVLIVGWRGMEAEFNREWVEHAPDDQVVQFVARHRAEGFRISDRLRDMGWKHRSLIYSGDGFSPFVHTGEVSRLLDNDARSTAWTQQEEAMQLHFALLEHEGIHGADQYHVTINDEMYAALIEDWRAL